MEKFQNLKKKNYYMTRKLNKLMNKYKMINKLMK